jgi:hypothetical protein
VIFVVIAVVVAIAIADASTGLSTPSRAEKNEAPEPKWARGPFARFVARAPRAAAGAFDSEVVRMAVAAARDVHRGDIRVGDERLRHAPVRGFGPFERLSLSQSMTALAPPAKKKPPNPFRVRGPFSASSR